MKIISISIALLLLLLFGAPIVDSATLAGTAQPTYISLQAYLGPSDYAHQTVIDYVSPQTQTATVANMVTISVPASTSYQAVNLATLFPSLTSCVFLSAVDVTSPGQGFSISTVNGSGNITVAPGAWFAYMPNSGAPPTVYLTNTSTTAALVQISVMSL
jgi:hypothetical protein